MDESLWTSDMALIFFGVCHSLIYPHKISADHRDVVNSSTFYLDPSINYRIFIHDPKFYLLLSKNGIFPRIFLQYKSGQNLEAGQFDYYEISVTEHRLLNRPEQPCEEEEDYDFLQCVKTSQARRVGCRPPWDSWSPHTIPLCQTVDQLQHHERLDWADVNLEQKMIVNNTGCQLPCHYREYQVAGEPQGGPAPALLKRNIGDRWAHWGQ